MIVKGIDQEAFHYGLHHHSQIICFVCENMLNKIQEYKKSIRMGKVVFWSAVDPAKDLLLLMLLIEIVMYVLCQCFKLLFQVK